MNVYPERANTACLGILAWIILIVASAFAARHDRSLRGRRPPSERAFVVPLGARLFMAMVAVLLIAGVPLVLYVCDAYSPQSHHTLAGAVRSMTVGDWLTFGLSEGMGLLVGLGMLKASGPDDLFLDQNRRTYRLVRGGAFRPAVQEGTWEDMAGIYVWRRPMSEVDSEYLVYLTWKRDGTDRHYLGSSKGADQAERLAEEITALLGLPRVEPPPTEKWDSGMSDCFP